MPLTCYYVLKILDAKTDNTVNDRVYVYMDGMVCEVNVRVLRKGLEQLSANGSRFEITSCYLQMIQR